MKENVILVDEKGNYLGLEEKLVAHQKGLLHKAFSIFIYNDKNEMLLQKRASEKYHFAGLWSNACCSHPREGETTHRAALRRLNEELGIRTDLESQFVFLYKATDDKSGLIENELDEIFTGKYSGIIPFNIEEVEDVRWVTIPGLKKEIELQPEKFTFWFKELFKKLHN